MRIVSGAWDMTLNLPDLGKQFRVNGLNNGNTFSTQAANGKISDRKSTRLNSSHYQQYRMPSSA